MVVVRQLGQQPRAKSETRGHALPQSTPTVVPELLIDTPKRLGLVVNPSATVIWHFLIDTDPVLAPSASLLEIEMPAERS